MKVKLQIKKDRRFSVVHWTSCSPFVQNSQAQLIHRPRYITTHKIGEKYKPHLAIESWCGNTSTGTTKFTFLDAPPDGKFVCARCEKIALQRGQKSSDELAGKHVHVGGVVAVQKCCIPAIQKSDE